MANFSRFKLQEYDDAYHAWEQTAEGDEREALLQQLYAIEQEYLPEIPVYNDIRLIGAAASLEGLTLSRIGAYEYQNAVVYTDWGPQPSTVAINAVSRPHRPIWESTWWLFNRLVIWFTA